MTGYARAERAVGHRVLALEAKSVNHRYLEIAFRLPEELRALEPELRALATARLGRGKVEIAARLATPPGEEGPLAVNEALVERLLAAAARVTALGGSDRPPSALELMRWPGVLEEPAAESGPLEAAAREGVAALLDDLVAARRREGERMAALLKERCDGIEALVARMRRALPALREGWLAKLRERVGRLGVEADPGRLEQELALAAQKADVDEELDRLDAHVAEIRDTLGRSEPVGRRLDFLIQELNREANTLGSKTADAETSRTAVDLKVLIEQMREQVQNVE